MDENKTTEFLRREKDRELLRKRAEKLARSVAAVGLEERKDSCASDYVLFDMGGDVYAIETALVKEVLEPEDIVPVPCTPDFIKGVVSVRGKIWSVIDLCLFWGLGKFVSSANPKVMLLSFGEKELGVAIDDVIDVIPLRDSDQKPLPVGKDSVSHYALGLTSDRKTILDGQLLIDDQAFVINEFVGNI